VQRAIIGVNIQNVDADIASKQNLSEIKGALVTRIIPSGSAQEAGMKENDVIVKFDGQPVNTVAELQEQVGKHRPGDKATVTYIRNGKESTIPITLKNVAGNTKVVTTDMETDQDIVFGARLKSLSPSELNSLNIDYGVKVLEVNKGKFKDIGMAQGYIIMGINGKKVRTPDDVRQMTDNGSKLKSIDGVLPDGTEFNYTFGK
jgi:serine protease Do